MTALLQLALVGVSAASWLDAISKVESKANEYREYAIESGTSWAGTMYNGYMVDEHRCAILGRMLGHPEAIRHIEEFDYPPMDERSDPHDLLVFSISLENWVGAASWAVDADRNQRINRWNLDCVGRFGIPGDLFIASDNPNAEFTVEDDRLFVYGDIAWGFAGRLRAALESNPTITEVILGSGGGSVRDALMAGMLIRERQLNTTIHGNCFSACPLVFMGGLERVLWASPYRLGFHQVSRQSGAVPMNDNVYALISRYVDVVGGDPGYVLGWMRSASPSDMYEPELKDLCLAGVATFVQRVCGRDW